MSDINASDDYLYCGITVGQLRRVLLAKFYRLARDGATDVMKSQQSKNIDTLEELVRECRCQPCQEIEAVELIEDIISDIDQHLSGVWTDYLRPETRQSLTRFVCENNPKSWLL